MSRIGKLPIPVPDKIQVTVAGDVVKVKGEKGALSRTVHPDVKIKVDNGTVTVSPVVENRKAQALQGLFRSLVSNMVIGVSKGFTRVLEVNGIGYRVEVVGKALNLSLGFSHPIDFPLPDGISATADKNNTITLSGIDKELLGRTAAAIRSLRPPEPYKGKGIKYAEENIRRKAGKTGAK